MKKLGLILLSAILLLGMVLPAGNIDKVDYLHLTPYDYVEYISARSLLHRRLSG